MARIGVISLTPLIFFVFESFYFLLRNRKKMPILDLGRHIRDAKAESTCRPSGSEPCWDNQERPRI